MREVHAYGCGPFRAYYHPRFSRAFSSNKQIRAVHTFFLPNLLMWALLIKSEVFLFFVYICPHIAYGYEMAHY